MGPFHILTEQHRELEELLGALGGEGPEDSAPGAEEQRERAEELLALVRLHTQLEERYLYPLLARVEGRARASAEAEDHLTMRELMEELEDQPSGAPEWWACLTALEDLLVAHVHEEEQQTFSRLLTVLDEGEQDELRRALEALREEQTSSARAWPQNHPLMPTSRWET